MSRKRLLIYKLLIVIGVFICTTLFYFSPIWSKYMLWASINNKVGLLNFSRIAVDVMPVLTYLVLDWIFDEKMIKLMKIEVLEKEVNRLQNQ